MSNEVPEITPRLLTRLRERYTDEVIPPCRICGAALEVACAGGGVIKYACSSEDAKKSVFGPRSGLGPPEHEEHYRRSEYQVIARGDREVLALVAAYESLSRPGAAGQALGPCTDASQPRSHPLKWGHLVDWVVRHSTMDNPDVWIEDLRHYGPPGNTEAELVDPHEGTMAVPASFSVIADPKHNRIIIRTHY